jgi:hypothetical protein
MQRFLVVLANDTPPATLFTDDRETRLDTLNTANVLASDGYEAIALATKASPDFDPRPLAALTVDELKAMTEALERFPFSDSHRVDFSLDRYTTIDQVTSAITEWQERTAQQGCTPEGGANPLQPEPGADADIASDQTAQSELDEILQPLLDLFNRKYRGTWEEKFRICHEARFRPLSDPDCALIDLPDDPEEYPEIDNALRELVCQSEACLHSYRGRPDGEGPVCGPLRFSVQKKAYSDDGCGYVYGTHLVVEREDLDAEAAKRQIAYLYRTMRDQKVSSGCRP